MENPEDLHLVFFGEDDDAVDFDIEDTGQYDFDGLWHTTTHNDSDGDADFWSFYYGLEVDWNYDTGSENSGFLILPPCDIDSESH